MDCDKIWSVEGVYCVHYINIKSNNLIGLVRKFEAPEGSEFASLDGDNSAITGTICTIQRLDALHLALLPIKLYFEMILYRRAEIATCGPHDTSLAPSHS